MHQGGQGLCAWAGEWAPPHTHTHTCMQKSPPGLDHPQPCPAAPLWEESPPAELSTQCGSQLPAGTGNPHSSPLGLRLLSPGPSLFLLWDNLRESNTAAREPVAVATGNASLC